MAEDESVWYELPKVARLPLHVNDVESLRNMFEHSGWKVLMKIIRAEASKAGSDGLDLLTPAAERLQGTAAFGTLAWLLQFETVLEVETQGYAPIKHDDLAREYRPTLLDLLAQESSKASACTPAQDHRA